ncbi:cytochrome c [Caulobacter sp. S45]|jgi:cytochrome c6|uniref:c-type cytochrome n=1 Tax=Caulobacter sp. S45 TaxID=1641861 RepID=UPI0020B15306|nr:cytochrome c [Caulobacter sp. S45]
MSSKVRAPHGALLWMLFGALALAEAAHAEPPDGAAIFKQNCAACHQARAQGVPGAFPALAGDAFVNGDPKAVAQVLLNGRGGMPNFREDLTNEQIASVLSYVRTSWGNHASPLSAATVASAQGGKGAAHQDSSVLPGH